MITLFIRHITYMVALLVVYLDYFLLLGSAIGVLTETIYYLKQYYVTKDMGKIKVISWY